MHTALYIMFLQHMMNAFRYFSLAVDIIAPIIVIRNTTCTNKESQLALSGCT